MELDQAKKALMDLQSKLSAYGHAMALISYEGATTAPKGTADNRGHAMAVLSEEAYKLATSAETVSLLEYLDSKKDELTEKEQRMVYLLLKDIRAKSRIPMEEYVAYQALISKADDVWHTAKEQSDFTMFEPYLEKIVETAIRFAGYIDPDKDPYDHYLDDYEKGLTKEKCEAFFATLRERIVPLIKKIGEKPAVDESCILGNFTDAQQEEFGYKVMDIMSIDKAHCGLATTEHPFTTSLGSHHDVRITTKYVPENLSYSMYSVIHEGGHALYELNSAEDMAYTVLDGGVSMGIHESQSRFYENILGRSRAFAEYVFPFVAESFPEHMKGYTAEDFYKAINAVKPSLIRTEADEVTYCLHVMIRYEIEKGLFAGEIKVHDLPEVWNRLYKEYLGVDVPDDKNGVLQDSHWSTGLLGYFPSYALGSAYGAQLYKRMQKDIDVEECLRKGDFKPINEWNREHIWQYGQLIEPGKLIESAMGEPFDPTVYADYLETKYTNLYEL